MNLIAYTNISSYSGFSGFSGQPDNKSGKPVLSTCVLCVKIQFKVLGTATGQGVTSSQS